MADNKTYAEAASDTTGTGSKKNRNRGGGGTGNQNNGNNDKFDGDCPELKGHIFDTHSTNPKEGFYKTTRQIAGYVGRSYTRAGEFRIALETLELPELKPPKLEASKDDAVAFELWKIQLQEYKDDVKCRKDNTQRVFSLILGQCTTSMKDRLHGRDGWDKINNDNDVITLLKAIQEYSTTKTSDQDSSHKLMDAEVKFLTFRQKKLSNADYLVAFKDKVEVLERVKGERLGIDKSRVDQYILENYKQDQDQAAAADEDDDSSLDSHHTVTKVKQKSSKSPKSTTDKELLSNAKIRKEAEKACRQMYLATNLLMRSDPRRYSELIRATQNDYTRHRTPYPKTLASAFRLLDNFISEKKDKKDREQDGELSFVQDGGETTGGGGGRGRGRGGRGGRGRGGRGAEAPPPAPKVTLEATPDATAGKEPIVNADIVEDPDKVYSLPDAVDLRRAEAAFMQRAEELGFDKPTSMAMWLIMDSGSTIDMVSNLKLLTDVRKADHPVTVRCNAGVTVLTHQGKLGGYPSRVWYHPKGITNILGLKNLKRHYRVTFDSALDDAFYIHHNDGATSRFAAATNGLYLLDGIGNTTVADWCLIATVKEKRALHGTQPSKQADLARKIQDIIMRPSTRDYMKYIDNGLIRNCPVERKDVLAAEDIHGPNLGSLMGKTPRRNTTHIKTAMDPVPAEILSQHREVTVETDIMYVNKIPFLVSISRGLNYGTVDRLENRQVPTIKSYLKKMCRLYRNRGFKVTSLLADNEFESLEEFFPQLDCSGRDDHIPTVERYIRTVKDRVRGAYNLLPFQRIPKLIVTRVVTNAVFWLNALPPMSGNDRIFTPRYIMTGRHIDCKRHVRAAFGQYVQTHEEHSNDMTARAIGAICLGPTGNSQGTHYFFNVTTGAEIKRTHWTDVTMPDYVIHRVTSFGRRQKMPKTVTFADRYGKEIHDHEDDIDDDHDSLYHPDEDPQSDYSLDYDSSDDESLDSDTTDSDESTESLDGPPPRPRRLTRGHQHRPLLTGVGDSHRRRPTRRETRSGRRDRRQNTIVDANTRNNDIERDTPPPPPNESDESDGESSNRNSQTDGRTQRKDGNQPFQSNESTRTGEPSSQDDDKDDDSTTATQNGDDGEEDGSQDGTTTGVEATTINHDDDDHDEYVPVEDRPDFFPFGSDQIPESVTQRYGRTRSQTRQNREATHDDYNETMSFFNMGGQQVYHHYAFLTAQMTAKKGLQVFGERGADAIVAEMQQIHYRRVLKPMLKKDLSRDEIKAALHYLMFLKEKRCGRIKARGCADGRKQRLWKTKEETSAPTVRTESVFLTAAIDAKEGRKVVTCDIPGAFMQADMDETVHVKFAGEVAELLCKVDPKFYRPYVAKEKGKSVVYCELRKALYGTLQAALLFWKELSGYLIKELGFKLNPYDDCVANKTINGKQMTILWHVDDLKISHMEQSAIEDILVKLNERFGQEAPITVTRGKIHDYLGMTLEFGDDKSVTFRMDDFTKGIVDEAPDDMQGLSVTPAANYLFSVNEEAEKLNKDTADIFHHLVAKLLYLCKRARPDIHTAVAFLTTRVTEPDIDDYKKLKRCIQYLRETPDLALRLQVNDSGTIEWWVDASFAVHPDAKGHTGAMMTLGKGAVYTMSTRQKVNTKSSTICELVGVDDAMPNIIWMRRFLEGQSYEVTDNIIYQDNQSAMLLERNGRRSCGKNTRHIDIRYFFITDRIQHGDCRVEYCPTDEMEADPFTKPLQGSKFRKFRQRMLNIPSTYRFQSSRQNDDSLNNNGIIDPNRTDTPQECVETSGHSHKSGKIPTSDSRMKKAMSVPIEDEWIQINRKRGKSTKATE